MNIPQKVIDTSLDIIFIIIATINANIRHSSFT